MKIRQQTVAPAEHSATLARYVIGYTASVIFTLVAYVVVTQHAFMSAATITIITVLAVLQFVVQLVFFLHLGDEMRPRHRLLALLFMLLVVVIIVYGSIWIMQNLNYNMNMSPSEQKIYLHQNEGL